MGFIIGFVVVIIVSLILIYNIMIKLRNNVRKEWSNVDVTLKERSDLIPNLIECVKGYMKHEDETFDKVLTSREKFLSSKNKNDEIKNDQELEENVHGLFALIENYPDLKASSNFIELQNELSEIESKISATRLSYNDAVLNYQNKRETFPIMLFASLLGFQNEKFIEIKAEEREVPQVKF